MKRLKAGRDVPALYQGIAAQVGRSRAAAVKLFCLECVGYARKDVTDCTALQCPLYRWRPYQAGEEDSEISAEPQKAGVNASESTQRTIKLPDRLPSGRFCK